MKQKRKERLYRGALMVIAILLIISLCLPTFMFIGQTPGA